MTNTTTSDMSEGKGNNVVPINSSIAMPPTYTTPPPAEKSASPRSRLREPSKSSFPNRAVSKINEHTPGTLAHAFYQQQMDHATVYAFLLHIQDSDPRVEQLILAYDQLSTEDKFQINVWDALCKKYKIPVDKLYGKIASAAFRMARSMSFMTLAKHENQIMERLAVHAKKERNIEHTKLYTEVAGLTGKQALGAGVNIQFNQNVDNSTKTVNVGLPSLEESIDSPVRQVREAQARMLESGEKTDFITVEEIVSKEGEKEYVESKKID